MFNDTERVYGGPKLIMATSYRAGQAGISVRMFDLGLEALRAHHRSDEGHDVDEETDPTGDHLEPKH